MAKITTASVLIDSIKRRAAIPENQATFTAEDFLEFADEELLLALVPNIISLHEDFLLYELEVPLVTGKSEYEIPSRAVANKLRDVQYKPDANTLLEMTRIGIGERFADFNNGNNNFIKRYYLKNNRVVLTPSPGTSSLSGSLVMIFYIKPSHLVMEDRVGVIQGINDLNNGNTEIVLNALPENFNTSILYDVYKAESPSTILNIDMTPGSINTINRSVTFATTLIPDDLRIGDHLAQSQEATIPQVPSELQPMLAQMVACRCLEAQGDTNGLQNALLKLKQMTDASGTLIDNRVEDAPQKIVNRHSLLRAGKSGRNFNRR